MIGTMHKIGSLPTWSCLCFLAAMNPLAAGELSFEHITIEDGLSQSAVLCMLQDKIGFLWVGTADGLNRYDGYNFKVHRNDPANPRTLSDNYIARLLEDQAGDLWVVPRRGFCRLDRQKGDFERFEPGSEPIRHIFEDSQGVLWLSAGDELIRVVRNKDRSVRFVHQSLVWQGVAQKHAGPICEDGDGTLWVMCRDGLLGLDGRRQVSRFIATEQGGPVAGSIQFPLMVTDPGDPSFLWLGSFGQGLVRLNPVSGVFTHFQNNPRDKTSLANDFVHWIYSSKKGVLWFATTQGLERFDRERQGFDHFQHRPGDDKSLSLDDIGCMYSDRGGVFWVGTLGGGLNKHDPGLSFGLKRQLAGGTTGLSHNMVLALAEPVDQQGDILWIGTIKGLSRWDRRNDSFVHYQPEFYKLDSRNQHLIRAIFIDSSGLLWVGTDYGLKRMKEDLSGFLHYFNLADPKQLSNQRVYDLCEDGQGNLWVGTSRGLIWIDHRAKRSIDGPFRRFLFDPKKKESINQNDAKVLLYDPEENQLWVGTLRGLNRMDLDQGLESGFQMYVHDPENPHGLSQGRILSLYKDEVGRLWVGTEGGGLNKMTDGSFVHYRERQGLPNDTIYSVTGDARGYLWLSTNKGLARFDPRMETVQVYDVHDGLQSNEFNTGAWFQSSSGEIFLGGVNGFNYFFPDSIKDNPVAPRVVITDLLLANKVVGLGPGSPLEATIEGTRSLRLDHAPIISFRFSALHYAAPKKNRYAYRLKGFNEDWMFTDSDQRTATYTNLDPGNYTFQVKGSNKDGVWNERPVSLLLVIPPPLWQTWWAYGLYGLAILSLVGFYLKFQRDKLDQARHVNEKLLQLDRLKDEVNRTLEQKVAARTREIVVTQRKLVETARTAGMAEIAAEVLHNVGNTLNSASVSASQIEEALKSRRYQQLLESLVLRLKEERGMEVNRLDLARSLEHICLGMERRRNLMKGESLRLAHFHHEINRALAEQRVYTETGGLDQKVALDLNGLIEDTLLMNRYIFEQDGVDIEMGLADLPLIYLDEARFKRVLFYLLNNAREALIEHGPGEGRISLCSALDDGRVRVDVSDNGVGISAEQIERVFSRGFSTKRNYRGFGLHYCANAIKEMKGEIRIVSEGNGKGTTVSLYLPLPSQ